MSSSLEQIKLISGEIISAAKKRRQVGSILRKRGFISLGKGGWLGFRGDYVVSGLLVEGSPSDTYISSFVLPVFDELKFITWALGRRIVRCSANDNAANECDRAISEYRTKIATIASPAELIRYLDSQNIGGFYPIWVRYLCYLREGRFEEAFRYLDDSKKQELHKSALKKLAEITPAVQNADAVAIRQILESWENTSRQIFGSGDFLFDVFN